MCRFTNFVLAYMKCELPKLVSLQDLLNKPKNMTIDSQLNKNRGAYKFTVKSNEVVEVFNDKFGIGSGIIDGSDEDLKR